MNKFLVHTLAMFIPFKKKRRAFRKRMLNLVDGSDLKFLNRSDLETILSKPVQDAYDTVKINEAKKLVIFFEIEPYRMCGGQMSLFSYCKYSQNVLGSNVAVVMTTLPGSHTYCHNDNFDNDIDIWRWEQVREFIKNKDEVILHIPEVDIVSPENKEEILKLRLTDEDYNLLKSIKSLQINIVNQQIELMPSPDKFDWLYSISNNITMTVCNKTSSTQEVCNKYNIPLHMLSVYYDLGKTKRISLKNKEKLILLSPDVSHGGLQYKIKFIKKINEELPEYKVFVIQKLKFSDCMRLTASAMAVVTFGEGFDGYLNNSPQVGTMAFAVYNDVFFPDKKWKDFCNIYNSEEDMMNNFTNDIKRLSNDENKYNKIVNAHEHEVYKLYKFEEYIDNLERFYRGSYDFYPQNKKGA